MMIDAEAEVRALTSESLASLVALEQTQLLPRARKALARELADGDTRVFGIGYGGGVMGYASVTRLPFEAELQALLVARPHRRRGVARRLLAAVVEQSCHWESERLLLEVRSANAGAIALYQAFGFSRDGCRRAYYPPLRPGAVREDALLMSLPLH